LKSFFIWSLFNRYSFIKVIFVPFAHCTNVRLPYDRYSFSSNPFRFHRNDGLFAVVALPYGVEGFATPKHLVKEDGSQAQLDEKLPFKVIEFNKDAKRIIVSHSRIFEDAAKAEEKAEKKASKKASKKEETPMIQNQAASTTLGDIDALAALKEQLEGKK
jgi:hypothetical protein